MQVYLGGYRLYGFDWRKAFGARYMAWNPVASQEHGEDDKNNMKYGSNTLTEGDRDVWLLVISHQ